MWQRLLTVVVAAACAVMVAACGSKVRDCQSESDPEERDWCHYEVATALGADGLAEQALTALRSIQSPMIRSAAINKLVTANPGLIPFGDVQALCGELPQPQSTSCYQTWQRPHLWDP